MIAPSRRSSFAVRAAVKRETSVDNQEIEAFAGDYMKALNMGLDALIEADSLLVRGDMGGYGIASEKAGAFIRMETV